MRGFMLATLALALAPAATAHAQADRHGPSIYDDLRDQGSIYDRGIGSRHGVGYHGHHHRFNYGLGSLYGHGLPYYGYPDYGPYGYGYGYGYSGIGIRGPGYSFNTYTGPANLGPLINPPVLSPFVYGYGPSYGYGSYGYGAYNYGPAFGYGTSGLPPNPVNNQWLQQQYNDEWTRLQAELADRLARNLTDPTARTTNVPVPSTPEERIKSLRLQSQGDNAFQEQDWRRAYERYRSATKVTPDDGAAFMKTGYALVALGRYSQAVGYFKRALQLDPLLATTGPPPTEMYGENRIAWTTHLGRLTRWVAEDVRESDRVLLIGTLLFLQGDPRGREFLEKAWQLSGGQAETVVTLLRQPEVEVAAEEPVVAQPAEPPTEQPNAAPAAPPQDELIPPPPPENNTANITQDEQAADTNAPSPDAAAEPAADGPVLGPTDNASSDKPAAPRDLAVPPPPAGTTEARDSAYPEHEPLFPLPSEQEQNETANEVPPLPPPAN